MHNAMVVPEKKNNIVTLYETMNSKHSLQQYQHVINFLSLLQHCSTIEMWFTIAQLHLYMRLGLTGEK